MIKGTGSLPNGKKFVLIGLSGENWTRLHTGGDEGLGQPISFNISELGLKPLEIVIIGSETEEGLRTVTQEFFGRIIA